MPMITQMYPPQAFGLHRTPAPTATDPTRPDCIVRDSVRPDIRMVWVDGRLYLSSIQAAIYLKSLGFTTEEAGAYLRKLPVRSL